MKPSNESPQIGRILLNLSLEKFATTLRADFRFAPLNVLLLVGIFVVAEAVMISLASAMAR